MKKLSRGMIAALAAVIAIPAGFAIAKSYEHGRWHRMSPETRERLNEGKLAMAKTALKLTSEQETLWLAVETEVRGAMKARAEKRAEFEKMREERRKARAEGKRPDIAERFERMSQRMGERAERMKAFTAAFKPFYASLSDEQKDVLRPLIRNLVPALGRGHHRGRWAHGKGWGGRHGFGHHGGGGRWRHHDRHDGAGADGASRGDATPEAPNNTPERDDDDDDTSPNSDNL